MVKQKQNHVTPRGNGWAFIKAGNIRATSLHETQQDAFEAARTDAKLHGDTEVIIHGRNGKIRESNTYYRCDDPRNIKG
jgi:hypothetical protein